MELFKRNKRPHPLVYMRGVESNVLEAMVEFLYNGEANVDQGNLGTFLALADELRLQGLNGTSEEEGENSKKIPETPKVRKRAKSPISLGQMVPFSGDMPNQSNGKQNQSHDKEWALALNNSPTDGDLDNQIKSMMEKSENNLEGNPNGKARICKICGKEGRMTDIQNHIEANHITGVAHDCKVCGKIVKTRTALKQHMKIKHNE